MGAGRKQHIGNKYFATFQHVVAEKADAVVELIINRKSLWKGWWPSGRKGINAPKHMGGDEKEGGISGDFDLMDGSLSQGVNDHMQTVFGPVVSAYRGFMTFVSRGAHIGSNTGRLPDWWYKLVHTSTIIGGWKEDKALGYIEYEYTNAAVHITMDITLAANFSGLSRNDPIAAMIRAMKGYRNDVRIIAIRDSILMSIERLRCDDGDYEDLAVWVEALPFGTGVVSEIDLEAAANDAADFYARAEGGISIPPTGILAGLSSLTTGLPAFNNLVGGGASRSQRRKVSVMVVRSEPIDWPVTDNIVAARAALDSAGAVEIYLLHILGVGWDEAGILDNTADDGVPYISTTQPDAAVHIVTRKGIQWADVNAIHHARYILTTPRRGGQALVGDIGASFDDAADQCFDEGMFLSLRYSDYEDGHAVLREIERHIDAAFYPDPATGKWEVTLIRPDYTVGSLPLLDSSIVMDWSGLEENAPSEPPNQITVTYTKRNSEEPGSETRSNVAAVRRAGRIRQAEPVDYPGVTWRPLAVKLALRDVNVISAPRKMGRLTLQYLPAGLHRGSAVRLTEPLLGLSDFVVRIGEISEPDGVDNSVTIQVTEDAYRLGQDMPDNETGAPSFEAAPASPRLAMEAPYYVLVTTRGQGDTDDSLATNPDQGALMVVAGQPTPQHTGADIATDVGAGYREGDALAFSPVAVLESALTREADDDTVTISVTPLLDAVEENSLASIGSEIVRIDDMVVSGSSIILTIGRGCVDTVPVAHEIGESIIFWGPGDPDEETYLAAQIVDVKVITETPGDQLELADAPVDSVTFASRAIRPYPPGDFKVSGSYVDGLTVADVVLTWAHRDRLTQTALVPEDHTEGDIGPEAGTDYTVTAEAFNNSGTSLGVYYTATGITGTTHDYPDATSRPASTAYVDFIVTSVRDGYESWQSPRIRVAYDINQFRMTPETDRRITPEGDNRLIGG